MTGPAASPRSASAPEIDGRGSKAIRMWTQRRAEAGLPAMGSWDGPLVALAIALMWDKGVEIETERFRQARGTALDEVQIDVDLQIGHACVAEFTDRGESQRGIRAGEPAATPGGALTRDVFLALAGRRSAASAVTSDVVRHRLPFQRSVTA